MSGKEQLKVQSKKEPPNEEQLSKMQPHGEKLKEQPNGEPPKESPNEEQCSEETTTGELPNEGQPEKQSHGEPSGEVLLDGELLNEWSQLFSHLSYNVIHSHDKEIPNGVTTKESPDGELLHGEQPNKPIATVLLYEESPYGEPFCGEPPYGEPACWMVHYATISNASAWNTDPSCKATISNASAGNTDSSSNPTNLSLVQQKGSDKIFLPQGLGFILQGLGILQHWTRLTLLLDSTCFAAA